MTEPLSMPVATFAPSTQWAGARITWSGGQFLLEDHGPVTAVDVMGYDAQGWLVWATDGTRAWVGARATAQAQSATAPASRSSRSERVQRLLFVAIGVLLVVNLVLLLVVAHSRQLF